MEAIILLATNPDDAYKSVSYICTDIKENQEANHKLFFARMLFGGFHISKGKVEIVDLGNGLTRKDSELTGKHELIIFPAAYEEQLEKLKTNKDIILVKNCMSAAGESSKKQAFRKALIDWLLDDETRWDYSNVDLTENS